MRQHQFLFFFFLIYFFYLWWFLLYIEMKQPRVYMCSPSQSPLPPPSPPAPSRFSQCTRSEHLSHASNTSFLLWITVSQDWTQLGNPLVPLALAGLIHVFSECWLVKSGLGHSWVASFTWLMFGVGSRWGLSTSCKAFSGLALEVTQYHFTTFSWSKKVTSPACTRMVGK